MRSLLEYVELVKDKYSADNPEIGSSLYECAEFVVNQAFFDDEITAPIVDPLREKIIQIIKNGN